MRCITWFLLVALVLTGPASSFPQCDSVDETNGSRDLQLEATCNVFDRDEGLSWATIDFQYPWAFLSRLFCGIFRGGRLAGVRCFAGSGFTAQRYNRWECYGRNDEQCVVPDLPTNAPMSQ